MPSYKDKAGNWYCQFYYEDWTGTRKHKTKRGFKRKKDADKWENDFKSSSHKADIRMSFLIDEYVKSLDTMVKLGSIKETTRYIKIKRINLYIRDYFADAIVSRIKVRDVNEWLKAISTIKNKPLEESNRYYKGIGMENRKTRLSSRTLNTAKQVLSQIFKFGILNYGVEENPVEKSEQVKFFSNDRRVKVLTLEQYIRFYKELDTETYRVFFNVLYWAGLRLGEALALTPSDITPYSISVTKTIVIMDNKEYMSTPKSNTSIRKVEITRNLYFQLKNYIDRLYGIKANQRIFELKEPTIRNHMNIICDKAGLPRISPHILRHSYASLLYNETKNITVVSKQIGHASADTTYKFYSHMLPGEDRTSIDNLESIATGVQISTLNTTSDKLNLNSSEK